MNDTLGKLTESLLAGLASEANNPDAFDDRERKQREAIQDDDCFYPRSIDAHDDDDHRHYKAQRHAPKGGITIGGKFFHGGEFVKDEDYDKGTDEEKAALDDGIVGTGQDEDLLVQRGDNWWSGIKITSIPEDADASEMSEEVQDAVREYTNEEIYGVLNANLREGRPLDPYMRSIYNTLMGAIRQVDDFENPVPVFRNIELDEGDSDYLFDKMEEAFYSEDPVTMRGMISTDVNPHSAARFGGIRLEIAAIRGLDLSKATTTGSETELLLADRSQFIVRGFDKDERLIRLEQIQ